MKFRSPASLTAAAVLFLSPMAKADQISIRSAVDVLTKRFVAAYKSKDVETIKRELTPEFSWKRTDGSSLKTKEAMQGLKRQMERVVSIKSMSLHIGDIALLGDAASATVYCDFSGTIRTESGEQKKVSSHSKYKYYWVKTLKGWRIDGITDLNS
jgi:ketosteroid isomerase-like protein